MPDFIGDYGHGVVDECHHLSAFTFETALRRVKARFTLGLTATTIRKDGHHPIIFMQCGPIRFSVDARKHAAPRSFDHVVISCPTFFQTTTGVAVPMFSRMFVKRRRGDEAVGYAIRADSAPGLKTARNV